MFSCMLLNAQHMTTLILFVHQLNMTHALVLVRSHRSAGNNLDPIKLLLQFIKVEMDCTFTGRMTLLYVCY